MTLLKALNSRAGPFRSSGVNHEGQTFVGTLQIASAMAGRAVTLHYTATGLDGQALHEEFALLALADDQRPCPWPVMNEQPFVKPHSAIGSGDPASTQMCEVFATGPRHQMSSFREEITIECGADGGIVHALAWGMPGGEFAPRSRCELFPEKN
jgi:hypothetical protein